MSKILIIAEKPSVAADLAKVLAKAPGMGKFDKVGDHYENDSALIAAAVGHLVELKMPMTREGKNLPWGFKHLPAIPEEFELAPIEDSKEKLRSIVKLAKLKEVTRIVNACDAGREGELIFRYIMRIGKVEKPVQRLWMQSMTADAILSAWKTLRSEHDMAPLADAAVCRSEADWLVGLNATRALTAFNSRNGGFNLTPAGRVQTPTLSILAEREKLIQAFVPRAYHEVSATFAVQAGQYDGRWVRPDFKKDPEDDQLREERLWDLAEAEAIRERCLGKSGSIEEEKKEQKQSAKPLFDLTTLQREASGRFGFSAKRTLELAQRLYERHKALTYPRTDSRYLPEDYVGAVKDTMHQLASGLHDDRAGFAMRTLEKNWVFKTPRIFDNKKVSDHFAIIPTGQIPKDLDPDLAKIYDMVVRRFIAVFFPQAEFDLTTRFTRIKHSAQLVDSFKTQGRVLRVPGWLEVYGRAAEATGETSDVVPVNAGESAKTLDIFIKHDITKPPARYNEGTLLSAMENAGKLVDDEELAEAMKERGLGTPATRAATIEGLLSQKYIARDGRELVVTPKGLELVGLLQNIGIEALTSPEMTGDWEYKLRQMEQRQLPRTSFMGEIKEMTRHLVLRVKDAADASARQVFPEIQATCPVCQTTSISHTADYYSCSNPNCSWRTKTYVAQRAISPDEIRVLLTKGSVGPFSGFKNRFHKEFEAALELDDKGKVQFRFADAGEADESDPANLGDPITHIALPDGSGRAAVYETEKAYLCPDLKPGKEKKGVRISKIILQRTIPRDQAVKLFTEHKTDLLQGFISKSKRRFAAHLLFDPKTGKIGFEFAERKAPAKKSAPKRAKSKEKESE